MPVGALFSPRFRSSAMKRVFVVVPALVLVAVLFSSVVTGFAQQPAQDKGPELTADQARREVRLVDDLYKTAIVYMNSTYVIDGNSIAAGEAARDIFASMKKAGWHEARLVDATGSPLNPDNAPQNEFEKQAIAKILKGEKFVDQVVEEDGKKYLRAATLVPVVDAKCVICHPGNKVGGVLGAISYKVPVK
jgi:hypothetical protein